MGTISQGGNAPMNTLKPEPGQYNSYHPKFHPLPGDWAKQQLLGNEYGTNTASQMKHGSRESSSEIQKALAAERVQHEYWEEWQGVKPGKAVYENPRELQNTLLPSAKYGTEGRGYG
jgi:hypothetical protein